MIRLVEKYAQRPAQEWPSLFFTILNNRITDVRRWRRLRDAAGKLVSLFRERPDDTDLPDAGVGAEPLDLTDNADFYAWLAQQSKKTAGPRKGT